MKQTRALLDLYCGAGGAAMGYYRAGFTRIVGVDVKPQPRYPFEFVQQDALWILDVLLGKGSICPTEDTRYWLDDFDLIHASPPCKAFSAASRRNHHKSNHPDLLTPTLNLLHDIGKPFVVENVHGAPLPRPSVMLCGLMFGLKVLRHRFFFLRSFCSLRRIRPMPASKSGSTVSAPCTGMGITLRGIGEARNENTSTRKRGL
jgi:DNA (cytosine-5)-methyltransferase 1